MDAEIALSASLEDYLKTIFQIITEKQVARAKDIAGRLKVSGASVTGALRSLAAEQLINYEPYNVITLTSSGRRVAQDVLRRHKALRDFFIIVLAVDAAEADETACKMEHVIPNSILERLIQFAEFMTVCPRASTRWISGFGYYCDHGTTQENCERCISLSLEEVREVKSQKSAAPVTIISLRDMQPGSRARVVKVRARGEGRQRLVEMGITPGAMIQVDRVAPLGDPVDIKIKGYHLSLRREDTGCIDVEEIE